MTAAFGAGEKRGGSYAVYAEIGAGAMATVHLGRLVGARGFARTVAIKVLHPSFAKNKEFVARFVDEARLVARIHHPNVMPTLDVIADGDDVRIVMDYVAGETLAELTAQMRAKGERISPRIACAVLAGVLHGLHAAHEAKNEFGEPLGIVHLDVSPQNILIGADGTTRVLDFGIARARGGKANPDVTGKSAYLAPEQVRGAEVSPRTDVFAASIVLWEMLTGEPLFAAENHAATMQRVLGAVVPTVSDKVPALPARLDEVLTVGLKRDPAQRFATARDMALELEKAVVPALTSEVGRWVESVAGATLKARAAKVSEMEATSASNVAYAVPTTMKSAMPGLVSARELYDEQAASNLAKGARALGNAASLMHPDAAAETLTPERAQDGSVRWKVRSIPPPPNTLDVPPVGIPAPRPLPAARPTPQAPSSPSSVTPSMAAPTPRALPPTSRRRGKNRTLLWVALATSLVALAVLAYLGRIVLLPGYVRGVVIADAAAHGVTVTVKDAELAEDGVLLRGLTAKLVGVPQAACTIATADVRVGWGLPTKVLLGKTEVTIDGDGHATLAALDAWTATQRAKSHGNANASNAAGALAAPDALGGQIDIPTAHLVWTHPSVDVNRIEASALQGAVGSPTAVTLTDDAHFLTPSLIVETHAGTFGPWNLDVDRTSKGTRARLAFDPAVPDGANALLVDGVSDISFDVTIPRMALTNLGVPRTALGAETTLPQQVELAIHYGRSGRAHATATLRAALYGAHVPELGSSVDAHLSGDASGPSTGPLTVKSGAFSVGPLRGIVTGTVTPEPQSAVASLAWRAEPMPCSSLVSLPSAGAAARDVTHQMQSNDPLNLGDLARDLGALGEAVGAVKVTGSFVASGTVVVDSAKLSEAKFGLSAKNACGIALFQGR